MRAIYIQHCNCGAITITFDNGATNSMFKTTYDRMSLDTRGAAKLPDSYCCDHCVNHWGIDLCECGSGELVGDCDCGSEKSHDILGMKIDSFGAILKNFGHGIS